MSFNLTKKSETIAADQNEIGDGFELDGELFVRIAVPTNLKENIKGQILAISIETWRMINIDPNTEVFPVCIEATSSRII